MSTMERRRRRTFSPEFKDQAVRLVRESGKTIVQAAEEIGVARTALGQWVKQAEIDEGKGPEGAMTTSERQELAQLRRENRTLRMERDLLKKWAAFFAKETL